MKKIELKQEVFDRIKGVCQDIYKKGDGLKADEMMKQLMDIEGIPMHYPYHHFIMPAGLLTLAAIEKGHQESQLLQWLETAEERAKTVPGGFCGNCGTCGSAVGVGIFVSVLTGATPMAAENWQWANEATGKCLIKISQYPGPRCCKRTTFLAVMEGVPYINEKCGLHLEVNEEIECKYHNKNATCLEEGCPFYKEA